MNHLIARSGLFDDFFKDVAPGFYVRPLHGDSLPSPSQIKIDVKESPSAYTVVAEVPGVPKEDIHVTVEGSVVKVEPYAELSRLEYVRIIDFGLAGVLPQSAVPLPKPRRAVRMADPDAAP